MLALVGALCFLVLFVHDLVANASDWGTWVLHLGFALVALYMAGVGPRSWKKG